MNKLTQGYNRQYNITYNSREIDVDIPSKKQILLLDGEYISLSYKDYNACNFSWKDIDITNGIWGKVQSFLRIFPRLKTPEEIQIEDEFEQRKEELHQKYKQNKTHLRSELISLNREYYIKFKAFRSSNIARLIKLTFYEQLKEMPIECFQEILKNNNNPDFIITTSDVAYESLPSNGKPKDIITSEGILEAYEINGTTIFFMPLTGDMSDELILLWRKVLSEVLI